MLQSADCYKMFGIVQREEEKMNRLNKLLLCFVIVFVLAGVFWFATSSHPTVTAKQEEPAPVVPDFIQVGKSYYVAVGDMPYGQVYEIRSDGWIEFRSLGAGQPYFVKASSISYVRPLLP